MGSASSQAGQVDVCDVLFILASDGIRMTEERNVSTRPYHGGPWAGSGWHRLCAPDAMHARAPQEIRKLSVFAGDGLRIWKRHTWNEARLPGDGLRHGVRNAVPGWG